MPPRLPVLSPRPSDLSPFLSWLICPCASRINIAPRTLSSICGARAAAFSNAATASSFEPAPFRSDTLLELVDLPVRQPHQHRAAHPVFYLRRESGGLFKCRHGFQF